MSNSQSMSFPSEHEHSLHSFEEHLHGRECGEGVGGVQGSSIPTLGTQTSEAQDSQGCEVTSPKKRKRKTTADRSEVWRDFTRSPKRTTCTCNHCGVMYKCHSSRNGTSTLKSHLLRCARKTKPSGQKTELSFQAGKGEVSTWKYDSKAINNELTCLVVECELPFKIVEHPRWKSFCHLLNPRWRCPSRPTVRKNVLEMYDDMKKKIQNTFHNNGSKVSLTTDSWTSEQKQSFMVITAHYIDSDWTLKKKIINFTTIKSHKGEAMGRSIENCLKDWEIKKLFTITVDNASANDHLVNYLKRRFSSVILSEYVHVRCVAHIINLIVVEGMKESISSISRVRAAVKFIRASPSRILKFKECMEMERIQCKKSLCLDVCTRWNSTYLMLESAEKFEQAFERFEELEPQITSELLDEGGMPKQEDWIIVRRLITFLRYFYELTLKVSGTSYVTSSQFFHELSILFCVLQEMKSSDDPQMSSMASRMIGKCEKYWGGRSDKLNLLIFVVVVFDPRYKLQYLTVVLKELYDNQIATELAENVKIATYKMFNEYKSELLVQLPVATDVIGVTRDEDQSAEDRAKAKLRRIHSEVGGGESITELDQYLGERIEGSKEGDTFDVLIWWKVNSSRFPILSVIARDLLAIPMSTVASESAFSTGGRVLDTFRSSLTPGIVEALICVDDWLGGLPLESMTLMVEDLVEQEKFEQELAKNRSKSKGTSIGSSRGAETRR